jgi:hypothetical protein
MGNCKYCGKSAGFLKSEHSECFEKHTSGWTLMINSAKDAAFSGRGLETLAELLKSIAIQSYINPEDVRRAFIDGFSLAVESALDDGILSVEEEGFLTEFKDYFRLTQDELGGMGGSQARLVKAAILRDILEGNLKSRVNISGTMPFNFQKGEVLLWLFPEIDFYEQRTRTQYEGGSQGVSLRVAKGVYYRVGAFRGQPVKNTEMLHVDNGMLAVTDKHVYFSGSTKKFRIPYKNIIEFTPYEDGIGIQKDGVSAKPQIFKTGDGWFAFNLIKNLAQL